MSLSWTFILAVIVLTPVSMTLAFAVWLRSREGLSFEDKTKAWQVYISLISAMTTVVSGALIIGKYVDDQARLEQSRLQLAERERITTQVGELQAKRDRKARLYEDATRVATTIAGFEASELERVNRSPERMQFEQLYFAQLIGVESQNVEYAMVALREHFQAWVDTQQKPDVPDQRGDPSPLERALLNLSTACSEDLMVDDARILELNDHLSQLTLAEKPPE